MKKIFTLLLSMIAVSSYSADFDGTFEGGTIPDGWTVINSGDLYQWETVSYSDDYDLSGTITGYNSGGSYAVRSTTGRSIGDSAVDQWLISPSINVESGDVLNFMFAANSAYNGNTWVEEANRIKFDVLLSTGGTESGDFTNTLFSLTPQNVMNWRNYSISLEEFAGQEVHIAFRDYGNPSDTPYLTNSLFLDDIRINKQQISDLWISAITSPVESCQTQQNVTATISNTGFGCQSYTISYRIDDGQAVSETVSTPIEGGGTATYTFATPAVLTSGSSHSVEVWAETSSDSSNDNNAMTIEVEIGSEIEFPFTMTDENASTAFSSSGTKRQGYYYLGWRYYNDAMMKGWVYNSGYTSYLLSDCISLPKGVVKLGFDYMAVSAATLNVYLVTEEGVYDYLAGSVNLPVAGEYTASSMTLTVPDDGVYTIAITPSDGYAGSFYLDNITISEAGNDIETVSIDSPKLNATLAQSGIEVTATFRNAGGTTIYDVPVYYQLDGGVTVRETLTSIASGETLQHTFSSGKLDLTATGKHTLKVWTELDGDTNTGNDAAEFTITSYKAREFPFAASFEADESNDEWITYNKGNDLIYWEITAVVDGNVNYAKDGQQAAYINSASGLEHNDWLISPAVNAKEGNARISFYYTTRMTSSSGSAGCYIELYLAKTDDPETISGSEPLATYTVTDDNVLVYRQGYASVEIPDDGTYYIAFYNKGMGHDIILDDVRFDQAEDLCVMSAQNSAVSGFNLTDNEVTAVIANHGTTPRSGFKVTYQVNEGNPVEETVQETLAPGSETSYTFAQKVDISQPGTYSITVTVTDAEDSDTYNNSWTLPEFTTYANAQLPYESDLDSEEQRAQWTATGNWTIAANMSTSQSAYNGQGALYHNGAAPADGDWAYSGCIEIPAGIYDFSFFYRTFMNMTDAARYGQNFSIYLGTAQSPESMTIPVFSTEDAIVATKAYEKVLRQVEIEESGKYYIGVKCTTVSTWGTLYVDMISISTPVTDGIVLGNYTSDFAGNPDEWYRYNPAANFPQWTLSEGDGGRQCLTASRQSYFYSDMPSDLPGLMVAPAFKLKKGDEISVSMDYRITVDNIGNLSDDDKARINIGVYLASENLPQSFTTSMATGSAISGDVQTAKGEITIPSDGIYYIGVLADGQLSATTGTVTTSYELYSVALHNEGNSGIATVGNGKPFTYSNNTVRMLEPYERLTVYTVSGLIAGQYSGISEIDLSNLPEGIYVIYVESVSGIHTGKIIIK